MTDKERRERRREYMRQYDQNNRERKKELSRAYWINLSEEKRDAIRKRKRELYRQDPSKKKQWARKHYEKNREEIIKKQKARYGDSTQFHTLKQTFLNMYGKSCQCCEESIYEFLSLDHIKGVNRIHKSRTDSAYRRAIEHYDPAEYRVLCHNCNQATKWGRVCPHKLGQHINSLSP